MFFDKKLYPRFYIIKTSPRFDIHIPLFENAI